MNFELSWLSDPTVFSVGELPPHSDHLIYAGPAEAEQAEARAEEKMENLTTREAVDLVNIHEDVDSAGINMARQVVNEYEREQEDERIEAENKRLAEWRKKREAEERTAHPRAYYSA